MLFLINCESFGFYSLDLKVFSCAYSSWCSYLKVLFSFIHLTDWIHILFWVPEGSSIIPYYIHHLWYSWCLVTVPSWGWSWQLQLVPSTAQQLPGSEPLLLAPATSRGEENLVADCEAWSSGQTSLTGLGPGGLVISHWHGCGDLGWTKLVSNNVMHGHGHNFVRGPST